MGEVTFFVLNKSSDFWLIRCQCNSKTLVKSAVSEGTADAAFYWVHVWKAWFTCVCWPKHTEHTDGYFLNVRELVLLDITPELHSSVYTKLLCHMCGWLHVHKLNFPSSMEGTTSFALVDKSSAVATVKGSLAKPITSVGRQSPSSRLAKFSFNLAMKSVITSVMPAMWCFWGAWENAAFCWCSSQLQKDSVWLGMHASVPQDQWQFCLCLVVPHLSHSGV